MERNGTGAQPSNTESKAGLITGQLDVGCHEALTARHASAVTRIARRVGYVSESWALDVKNGVIEGCCSLSPGRGAGMVGWVGFEPWAKCEVQGG